MSVHSLAMVLVLSGVACGCGDGPTAPSRYFAVRPPASAGPASPPPRTVEITGRVWQHDASGMRIGAGDVGGFVFSPRTGYGLPGGPVAPDGSYRVTVQVDSLVYLTTTEGHQPCMTAVSTAGVSEVTGVDLHVVTDRSRLGANLPPDFPRHSHRVAGAVFEPQPDGNRVPIAGVWVGLDGASGDGLVIAGTLTDAEGRYILCGVKPIAAPGIDVVLFASLAPYGPFFTLLDGGADVVIDIPLHRQVRNIQRRQGLE